MVNFDVSLKLIQLLSYTILKLNTFELVNNFGCDPHITN